MNKVAWYRLSENQNAIHLLEQHSNKINWGEIWANPSIFTYDYEKMNEERPWREEFYFWVHHPDRIARHVDWGLTDELLIV